VNVVCCQVEVSASDCSLGHNSPTACDVSECDSEAAIMSRPWRTRRCYAAEKKRLFGAIKCGQCRTN
jgi:hypothetical protein